MRFAHVGVLLGLWLVASAAWAYEPVEVQVSPNRGLIDFEISQNRAKVVHTDPEGRLWLADIDRETGLFVPWHGRGALIATGTVSKANMFAWNGPEWVGSSLGDIVNFSYYRNGAPAIAGNTRMAMAAPDRNGIWVAQPLQSTGARMMHVTSRKTGDSNPQIKYLDPELNHYWRNLYDPSSERRLDFLPKNNKAWRFASGWRALVYSANVAGGRQVFVYMPDQNRHTQLTFDEGQKDVGQTVPWVFRAPEFGDELVLVTVVGFNELRIYRRFEIAGVAQWNLIQSARLPEDRTMGSPEWFTYNGKSYVFFVAYTEGNEVPSEVWLAAIDPAQPLLRKVTPELPYRARNDPEVFITHNGPRIYYNRYDSSIDPDHPLCADCSEGVYLVDPGITDR